MIPSSCSFTIILSEVITEKDIEIVNVCYEESETLKKFFTNKIKKGFPFTGRPEEQALPAELVEQLKTIGANSIGFEDSKENPKRKLMLDGQKISYSVRESISFSTLKTELQDYIFPLVLAANSGIWSFSLSCQYNIEAIDQNCDLLPKTLQDSDGWNCGFAKVIPWDGAPCHLYLIQRDFSAQKREEGINITLGFLAQRMPPVSPVLAGKEGEYVLGEVFETAFQRAIDDIEFDLNSVRG